MQANKMNQPNSGVKCLVDTCYYYSNGDHCTASKIEIAPKGATANNQTDCETFVSK